MTAGVGGTLLIDDIIIIIIISAGVGRTGTFCALSIAIERVKIEQVVNMFNTIKHLRTQRAHMVQTLVNNNNNNNNIIIIIIIIIGPVYILLQSYIGIC